MSDGVLLQDMSGTQNKTRIMKYNFYLVSFVVEPILFLCSTAQNSSLASLICIRNQMLFVLCEILNSDSSLTEEWGSIGMTKHISHHIVKDMSRSINLYGFFLIFSPPGSRKQCLNPSAVIGSCSSFRPIFIPPHWSWLMFCSRGFCPAPTDGAASEKGCSSERSLTMLRDH